MTVVATAAPKVLPVEEFIEDLVRDMRATKRAAPPRFWVAVYTGTASRAAIGRYACEQYAYSRHVVHSMAAAIANMVERESFLMLSENFSREAGFYQTPNHVDLLLDFGAAFGVGRQAMEQHTPTPETLGAMYTLDHFCRRSAAEAVAAFSLATEARGDLLRENREDRPAPPPLSSIFAEKYGLEEAALRFWRIHEEIEGADAEQGFQMIRTYADGAHVQGLIRRAVLETSLTFDAMWHGFDRFLDS
jgi:pyrroloquinoline quinone (PQQ) biosynthesis protein C